MTVDDRLAELGIELPESTAPIANFVLARRSGRLLFLAGHISKRAGAVAAGKVGADVDTKTAYDLARLIAIDLLATVRASLGSLDDVRFVKLTGFVNSTLEFTDQPSVINGASDLIIEVFGAERGQHSRSAIGVAQLPLGAAVEVEAIIEITAPDAGTLTT